MDNTGIQHAYAVAADATRLRRACDAMTLTNNASAGVLANYNSATQSMLTTIGSANSTLVSNGNVVTVGGKAYTFTVAGGQITAISVV